MPAAAIVGSALISGAMANKAAKKSANAVTDASNDSIAEQRRQFDLTREDTAPYRQAGVSALGRISKLYGLGANGQPGAPDYSQFSQSPEYSFNLGEGQKAIDRSLAARGRSLSGAGVKEGIRYASGMASNEFGNFYNRLASLAGIGQTGVNTSASAGMNAASNIGNSYMNAGNARSSAYMTGAQGFNNAVQGGISNYLLNQYLNKPPAQTSAPSIETWGR